MVYPIQIIYTSWQRNSFQNMRRSLSKSYKKSNSYRSTINKLQKWLQTKQVEQNLRPKVPQIVKELDDKIFLLISIKINKYSVNLTNITNQCVNMINIIKYCLVIIQNKYLLHLNFQLEYRKYIQTNNPVPIKMLKRNNKNHKTLAIRKQQETIGFDTIQALQRIICLQNQFGQDYLSKNSIEELILRLDTRHIQIVQKFAVYKQNGFNILQFVRFFLNILQHQHVQNLYLTIGLIDLFKAVSTHAGEQQVKLTHITNYLCHNILQRQSQRKVIPAKNIGCISSIRPTYQIKDFIRNPATIYGSCNQIIQKLMPNSIQTDKSKHSGAITSSKFSFELKMVFTLGSLSEFVSVYDFNCNLVNKIYPNTTKHAKDVVVMNFAFSQRQYRIGAVLKNFSIIFWDSHNQFQYQKSWSTTTHCQYLQSSIHYLDFFNSWITTDKTGTIYFWNLLQCKPDRKLKCKYYSFINNLCEIESLNLLAIVQQNKARTGQQAQLLIDSNKLSYEKKHDKKSSLYEFNIVLYNFITLEFVNEISNPQDRVPHTIQFSTNYQILFSAGMQRKIKLFEINSQFMDSSLKGQLVGHQNLVTTFTILKKTSLLLSCDDQGKIKLWDFKHFSCLQTIDFSDKALITNLLDMVQIGKAGIFGSRIHYIDFQSKNQVIAKIQNKQKLTIQWVDYDQNRSQIYIFTPKDLRVIDLKKGTVKYIYASFNQKADKYTNQSNDYTCFRYFSCLMKYAVGSQKGQVAIFDITTGQYLYSLNTFHQGSVLSIQYDQLNKFFITTGVDSNILVHRQSTSQLVRDMKNNFNGKEISCIQLSVYHNLIAISTSESQFTRSVFLWNYQFGKIAAEIIISQNQVINSLQFVNGFNILLIATNSGKIHFVRIKQLSGVQVKLQHLISLKLKAIKQINCHILLKGGIKVQLEQCIICTSLRNGQFKDINITQYIKDFESLFHSKQKSNYNPYRQSRQTFSTQYLKRKHFVLQLNKSKQISQNKSKQISYNDSSFNDRMDSTTNDKINSFYKNKIDSFFNDKIKSSPSIQSGFSQVNFTKLMNLQKRYILMVGTNRRLKIFNYQHKLICDMNINHPLPYLWQFKIKSLKKVQDKIYFAIKVINTIINKYQNDLSIGQATNFKLKALFDKVKQRQFHRRRSIDPIDLDKVSGMMITQPSVFMHQAHKMKTHNNQKHDKIQLIQQQYNKDDLNYDLIKKYNFHEIAGPTLKELDHMKKISQLQNQWKFKQQQQQQDRQNLLRSIQTRVRRNQQKQQLSGFLSQTAKAKQCKQSAFISNLRKKIDNVRVSTQKDQQITLKQKNILFNMSGSAFFTTQSMNKGLMSINKVLMSINKGLMTPIHKGLMTPIHKKQSKKQSRKQCIKKQQTTKTIQNEQNKNYQHQLVKRCLIKHKSLKSFRKVNTQTFQEYYHTKMNQMFKENDHNINQNKINNETNICLNKTNTSYNKKQQRVQTQGGQIDTNRQEFRRTNLFSQQRQHSEILQQKQLNKSYFNVNRSTVNLGRKAMTSQSKFRTILKQMNKQVMQKRIQKIKIH